MLGLFKSEKKVEQPKILVVDDEHDLVSTVEYRLKFSNCQVVTAENGEEGLEKAAAEQPDLILLDTNMPVMDGHEMLRELRAKPETADIPVIMLTAQYGTQDIATASAYGIADYITKPFDFAELMEKVERALNEA
ncbi:MAG: response regulator [Planctomycetes bacterium]|nr:response regulator [Planctomycetota bacterium]